ncbi:hypothetical protein SUGI_0790280 [Cryptomeria japonica]|nr:hypothetical protein SUGI_0790280 [Cryptomeria japonica]
MGEDYTLWELNPLFSAAEDVQQSAERLESAYRGWINSTCSDHVIPRSPSAYRKELLTAFETTKWQLEEFERAFMNANLKDLRTERALARYRPFIEAISHQISLVENDLRNSGNEEDGYCLHAVSIGDGERDELANFLSGNRITGKNDQNGYTCPRDEYQTKGSTFQERVQASRAEDLHQNMLFGSQLHGFQEGNDIMDCIQDVETTLVPDRVFCSADQPLSDKNIKTGEVSRRNGSIENGFFDWNDGINFISDRMTDHRKHNNRYQSWNSWLLSSWQYLGGKLQHSKSGLRRYKDGESDSIENSQKKSFIGCVRKISSSDLEKGESSSLSTSGKRWNGFSFAFRKAKQSALNRNKIEQKLLHKKDILNMQFRFGCYY